MARYGHILGIRRSALRCSLGMSWSELKLDLSLHSPDVTSGALLRVNACGRSRNTKNMTQSISQTTPQNVESF